MKKFSIKEVSDRLNMSQYTLRYYEKIGIIKINRRKDTEIRELNLKDIELLHYIKSLKDIGFSLEEIKEYSVMKLDDKDTLSKRKEVLKVHHTRIIDQIKSLDIIKKL